ncbi:unnamed protein product [Mytilus edulis]|uniref:Uncharacterized protein n=1 Tax=Mytilus edulis TaxID=6550 RepID=A0A8S3UR54_MYTED|nr:unnamed protein product [Mytilus edulis]
MRKMSQNKRREQSQQMVIQFLVVLQLKKSNTKSKAVSSKMCRKMARVVMNIISNASPKKHAALARISTPLPDKRLVNKDGKAAHIMHRSLLDTFQIYKEKNPSVKLGKSKFASLRPKNVKTFCDQQLQQCLCEYCLNVELKLKTVNKLIGRSCENAEELKIKDKYCAVNIVMCPKGDNQYHKKDCIDGLCNICGEQKMRTHLKDVTNKYGVDYYNSKDEEEAHQHHRTHYILVGKTEKDHAKHDKSFNCKTVSGTQKYTVSKVFRLSKYDPEQKFDLLL